MRQTLADRSDLVVVIDGKKLARACAARGWSFTQLAQHAHISRPTLAAAIEGRTIRPRTAWKIARVLGEAPIPAELPDLVRNS